MSNFGSRLKRLREERGLTQEQLGSLLGTSKQVISRYENNTRTPKISVATECAKLLGVPLSELSGEEDRESTKPIPAGYNPMPALSFLPVIGSVACGQPILAEQNIDGYASAPENWHADFVLVCKGRSMEPKINDGDLVAIRTGVDVENGQIAAVRIDDEATLKKVYFFPDRIMLQPINDEFEVYTFEGEDMNRVFIEGKAVGLCRSI